MCKLLSLLSVIVCLTACNSYNPELFVQAQQNGMIADEGYERCRRYVQGWMAGADSATGLIPRNFNDSPYWNGHDAAADNYPFMVLTAALCDRPLFEGRMKQMLEVERTIASRKGHLPDIYVFAKQDFMHPEPQLKDLLFGAAEYMKDGLIPVTELLGQSPWSERMIEILDNMDDSLHYTPELIHKTYGYIQAVEASGDLLQVLSRVYRMTGNKRYLDLAALFGDYYLNDEHLPTHIDNLRLRDHGCEVISGLVEAYSLVNEVLPEKKKQWQPFIHEMLDVILAKGRNEDGLFYNAINPKSGENISKTIPISQPLADTWGYTLDAVYTVWLIDGKAEYREAVLKAMRGVVKYKAYNWENGSSDGYADAIESALNLLAFEPLTETANWIDDEIKNMWAIQKPSGIIEGWHGDGNFARTTLMYCLWKTAGITLDVPDKNVSIGAVVDGGKLYVSISSASSKWEGKLKFGEKLHKVNLHFKTNYPRINQFQEWFPLEAGKSYTVTDVATGKSQKLDGSVLTEGYPITVEADKELRLIVK
jgi:hypothetical protein